MALAKGSRGTGEPTPRSPKKKKQPSVPPSISAGPVRPPGAREEGTTATPYRGQPLPTGGVWTHLRAGGIQSIFDLNSHAQAIEDAHVNRFGYKPSPGLFFDLLRAPVGVDEYAELFDAVPQTAQRARSAGVLRSNAETMGVQRVEELEPGPTTQQRALSHAKHGRFTHEAAGIDPETDRDLPGYGSMISTLMGEGTKQQADFAIKEAQLHIAAHARRARERPMDWRTGNADWNREVVEGFKGVVRALKQIRPTLPDATAEDEGPVIESLDRARLENLDVKTRRVVEFLQERRDHARAEGLRGNAMARFFTDAANFTRAPAFERVKNEAEVEQERAAQRRAMTEALVRRYGSNDSMNALQLSIAARNIAEGKEWDLYGDRINPEDPIGRAALAPANPFSQLLSNIETEAGDILRGTPPALLTIGDATVHDLMNLDAVARGEKSQLAEEVINPQIDYLETRYVTPFREKGVGGGFKAVGKSFYDQPVSGALDVFAAASIGVKAATLAGKGPRPRTLRLQPDGSEGVTVYPWQSPNPLTAYLENVFDRASEKWPTGMRTRERVAKEKSRDIRREQDRAKARVVKQAQAVTRISFNPVSNARLRNLLYWEAQLPSSMRTREGLEALRADVLRGPGERVEGLRAQLAEKQAQLSTVHTASKEARDIRFEVASIKKKIEDEPTFQKAAEKKAGRVEKAIGTQQGMSAKERRAYEAALEGARVLTDQTEQIKIQAGLLTAEQAANRRALISRRLFGEDAEPSDIFMGHRAKEGRRSDARLGRSRVTGAQISTKGMGLQRNELILWREGRMRVDPDVILEDWMRAQTFKFHSDIKQFFGQVAQPIGPDGPNPGWYLVNPKGKAKPGTWDDAVDAADPESLLEALRDYAGSYIAPEGKDVATLIERADSPGDILQLDPKIAHAFFNRYVGPQGAAAGIRNLTTGADLVFGLVKLSIVYANPGYIPANLVGNIVFGAVHQGPFLVPNILKAGKAMAADPELFRLIRAEVGVGPTAAIASSGGVGARGMKRSAKAAAAGEESLLRTAVRGERAVAHGIGLVPDVVPRVAAWYFEAEKAGFKTRRQQMDLLTKDEFKRQRDQIGRTAEEAMVNFDLLGPVERAIFGRAFFVWPWIRGAARWATRFPIDRPVRADVLATLAKGQAAAQDKALPDKEPWAEEMVQTDEEQEGPIRRVQNFASISPTGTSLGLIRALQELAHGETATRFHAPFEYLNPIYGAVFRTMEGKGPFGEQTSVAEAFKENAKELAPIAKIIQEVRNPPESDTYVDQSRKGILKRRILRFAPQDVRVEGITQVTEETQEQSARAERAQRLKDEIMTVLALEDMTAQIIGREVPKEVKDAIGLLGLFERDYADFAIANGREATPAEKARLQVERLEKEGRVEGQEAAGLRERLGMPSVSLLGTEVGLARQPDIGGVKLGTEEFEAFSRDFGEKYLGRRALREWYAEAYSVLDTAKDVQNWSSFLVNRGLSTEKVKGEVLPKSAIRMGDEREALPDGDFNVNSPVYEVARQYLAFNNEMKRVAEGDDPAGEVEGGTAWREDQHDKPIKVDGKTYPSPVRLAWAEQIMRGRKESPDYEERTLAALATGTWSNLSDFQKELLGRKPAERMSEGWFAYNAVAEALRGNITKEDVKGVMVRDKEGDLTDISTILPEALPPGQQEISSDYRRAIAKWVNRFIVDGFTKDFSFAEAPKFHRVQRLPIITKSEAAKDWQVILAGAQGAHEAMEQIRAEERSDYTVTELQDYWDIYIRDVILPWMESDPQARAFAEDVSMFGPDFLYTLVD